MLWSVSLALLLAWFRPGHWLQGPKQKVVDYADVSLPLGCFTRALFKCPYLSSKYWMYGSWDLTSERSIVLQPAHIFCPAAELRDVCVLLLCVPVGRTKHTLLVGAAWAQLAPEREVREGFQPLLLCCKTALQQLCLRYWLVCRLMHEHWSVHCPFCRDKVEHHFWHCCLCLCLARRMFSTAVGTPWHFVCNNPPLSLYQPGTEATWALHIVTCTWGWRLKNRSADWTKLALLDFFPDWPKSLNCNDFYALQFPLKNSTSCYNCHFSKYLTSKFSLAQNLVIFLSSSWAWAFYDYLYAMNEMCDLLSCTSSLALHNEIIICRCAFCRKNDNIVEIENMAFICHGGWW